MSERSDSGPGAGDLAGDAVRALENTFGLSAETARLTAEDQAASGARAPASDAVEEAREARAQAAEKEVDA